MRSQGAVSRLEDVAVRARPVALAREHVLPVLPPLEPLLPDGLRRGSTVAVGGSTSLALALVAGASTAGSWTAAAGVSSLGLTAASELGVALERLVVVAAPPPQVWGTVVATLVEAFDVVLARVDRRVRDADARRLTARARDAGSVLVLLLPDARGVWPDAPDVRLDITASEWSGIGDGYGHLHARRVEVSATGRRAAARARHTALWLPGPNGAVEAADDLAPVHVLPVAN
jgi:hypothetical protein